MINNISQFNTLKFQNNKPEQKPKKQLPNQISGVDLPGTKRINYSPLAIGAINGGCWFAVGMVFDKLSSMLFKQKLNSVPALIMESAIGLFMGIRAYKVAKAEQANLK